MRGARACDCPQVGAGSPPPQEKAAHRTHGNNLSSTLTGADRARIAALSRVDAILYARAVSRLYDGLRRFDLLCLLS